MELPNSGRVVIIDDRREEIEPLIDVLSQRNIPLLYFDGAPASFPDKPMNGIRIIFLDLCMYGLFEVEEVTSNATNIISKTISDKNGPFLLIIWSTTGDAYIKTLKEKLSKQGINPEVIISLSKGEYFTTKTSAIAQSLQDISDSIDKSKIDSEEKENLLKKLRELMFSSGNTDEKEFVKAGYEKLSKAIDEAIIKAGILSLFVAWENAIQKSTRVLVSNVYSVVSSALEPEERLKAIANSLAYKWFDKYRYYDASPEQKLQAAVSELNDFFSYFYESETRNIADDISVKFEEGNKDALDNYKAKINTWKLIRFNGKNETPGGVFIDKEHSFNIIAFASAPKEDTINSIKTQLEGLSILEYIYMNINGECEHTQNKTHFMKTVPGIIVEEQAYHIALSKKLRERIEDTDNFSVLGPFEYQKKVCRIIFSLDQCSYKPLEIEKTQRKTVEKEAVEGLVYDQVISKDATEEEVNDKKQEGLSAIKEEVSSENISDVEEAANDEKQESSSTVKDDGGDDILFLLNRRFYLDVRKKIASNYDKAGTDLYK